MPTQPSITATAIDKQDQGVSNFGPTLSITVSGANPYLMVLVAWHNATSAFDVATVSCTANGADLPLVLNPTGSPVDMDFYWCKPLYHVEYPSLNAIGHAVFGAIVAPGTYEIIPWISSPPIYEPFGVSGKVVQCIALQDVDPIIPVGVVDFPLGSTYVLKPYAGPSAALTHATAVPANALIIGQFAAVPNANFGSAELTPTLAVNTNPTEVTQVGAQLIADNDGVGSTPWVRNCLGWATVQTAVAGLAWNRWNLEYIGFSETFPGGAIDANSAFFLLEVHAVGEPGDFLTCPVVVRRILSWGHVIGLV